MKLLFLIPLTILAAPASYEQTDADCKESFLTRHCITVDHETGIKKEELFKYSLKKGGGYAGDSPHLTKQTITIYNKEGKLIYQSNKTIRLRGCIRDTPHWAVIAYDSSGARKTLDLIGGGDRKQVVIKSYDKDGQLTGSSTTDYSKFSIRDNAWIMRYENE